MKRNIACGGGEEDRGIYTHSALQDGRMQRAICILCAALLLASLPAGALAGSPLWRSTAPYDITCLSFPADGSYILTGGERICLFADDGAPLWREGTADLIACSADGGLIAGAEGLSLFLLSREGDLIWREEMPSISAHLTLSGDGKQIIVGDRFGKVYFYDMDGNLNATADTNHRNARSEIRAIATSDLGEYTAVISSRGLFCYKSDGRKAWAHEELTDRGTAIAISGSGDEIVAASDAGIRLLDAKGKEVWSKRFYRPVTAVAISGDGTRVFAGSQDNVMRCFDRAGEEIWTFEAGGWIRDIAVSRDASRILVGSMDRQAYLLDGAGDLLETYTLEESWANHVALSADGTAGVVASIHEVIGISMVETPAPMETVATAEIQTPDEVQAPPAETEAPAETTLPAEPTLPPEEDASPYLLLLGFFACGAVISVGYLYRERLYPPFMRRRI
ncbi:MAG: PQQ-binding-like beta-propeller repeat protein [Methanoculleus sp.]